MADISKISSPSLADTYDIKDTKAREELEILAAIADGTYEGTDLTVKFADEIAEFTDEWEWLNSRAQNRNYTGLHICDYISATVGTPAYTFQIAGIDTATGLSYNKTVGGVEKTVRLSGNIDLVAKETWASAANTKMNIKNYNNGTVVSAVPWRASHLYLFVNSAAGEAPISIDANPTMQSYDYSSNGIFYQLPEKIKNVIINKYAYVPERYSTSEILNADNSVQLVDLGKIWQLSEYEITGSAGYANSNSHAYTASMQYPIFANGHNRAKKRTGTDNYARYWTLSPAATKGTFVIVDNDGSLDERAASADSIFVTIGFRLGKEEVI